MPGRAGGQEAREGGGGEAEPAALPARFDPVIMHARRVLFIINLTTHYH